MNRSVKIVADGIRRPGVDEGATAMPPAGHRPELVA
jgi:hypothetical protein